MTKEYFEKQMGVLIGDFGHAEYTPAKINLIWDHCRDLPDYNFGRIIRHFLETKSVKYPPLPTHFHEAALEQKKLLESQGVGKGRVTSGGSAEWSSTPIKEIMKKLGGESALEALENQIKKQSGDTSL